MTGLAAGQSNSTPLLGRRIVVTRAMAQSQPLLQRLAALGADVVALPTIAIIPPSSWKALDNAIRRFEDYNGFIFTSANGVKALFERAAELEVQPRRAASAWTCAIGPATAEALRARGWQADIVPEQYVAESVVAALSQKELAGQRILLPRAAVAREVLPIELRGRGAKVDVIEAYQTVVPESSRQLVDQLFAQRNSTAADCVVFTSPSTVRNFVHLVGSDYRGRLNGVVLAAIGPITRTALEELGLTVAVQATEFTVPSLVDALVDYFSSGH